MFWCIYRSMRAVADGGGLVILKHSKIDMLYVVRFTISDTCPGRMSWVTTSTTSP